MEEQKMEEQKKVEQKTILIVTETKSILLTSMMEYFKKASYKVTLVPVDTDAVNGVRDIIGGILILANEELPEQYPALLFIKDRSMAENIPIFVVGTKDEIKLMKEAIPADIIRKEFMRPLTTHVSAIVNTIDSFIKGNIIQKKILVVDDSGPMLRTVKGWLEGKYNVFLANSGAMAIKYLTLNRPDLILLDYEMPVVDGRQLLEMLRTEADFASIPAFFLTKKNDPESIMNVRDLKPEGYLLKTTEPAAIVKAVDDFFMKQKALL